MTDQEINKRDVAATVLFAINNIPHTDEATLERFLELVNATGNFGPVSHRELVQKMILLKKYVPETCDYSLLALAELLGIRLTGYSFENVHLLLKEINY
jgi:hypothetical protein